MTPNDNEVQSTSDKCEFKQPLETKLIISFRSKLRRIKSDYLLYTFISATACEIGSLGFKKAKEHTEPLKARTPTASFWLQALHNR